MRPKLFRAAAAFTLMGFVVLAGCGASVETTSATPAKLGREDIAKSAPPDTAPQAAIAPSVAKSADVASAIPGFDEPPHFFLQEDGGVIARWISDGRVKLRTFAEGEAIVMPEFASLIGDSLPTNVAKTPTCKWDMPARLIALSDVEGQYDSLLTFLKSNGVVDEDGRWAYGEGHLVGVGDMVDRGSQVTEVLLLFYRLSFEASAAGGHVHFIIGNHEAMMMAGDIRYTAPKYNQIAELLGVSCEGLIGADTLIGRWLRSCNCIERIGDYLFVHAGLSPQTVRTSLDYEGINDSVRSVLGVPRNKLTDAAKMELSWGRSGPLWYRGYFPKHHLSFGPTPTVDQFQALLARCQAKHIVVGHTKVAKVATMYAGGLIPIDIPWTSPAEVRALVVEKGQAGLVDIRGEQSLLQ